MASSTKSEMSPSTVSRSTTAMTAITTPSPSPPEVTYRGFADLIKQIDSTTGDVLVVKGVSSSNFEQIDSRREQAGRKFRLSLYSTDSGVLIITIPTAPHEQLHGYLYTWIIVVATGMNLQLELCGVYTTQFTQRDAAGNRQSAGEGDSALKPFSQRPHGNSFPTIVIESGHTQSWPSLRQKARWWFTASHFDVKIVLLAKANRSSGQIIIEKWKAVLRTPTRPGATTTRAQATSEPVLTPESVDTIKITRSPGISDTDARRFDPTSYGVVPSYLRLEFEDVFLRQPNLAQGEGDIILGTTDLQNYAVRVWRAYTSEPDA